MYSWDNPDDRLSIVQMNSELQHAQLELLSAHCATHQLRLRFSAEDLARFGQRDILRKSVKSAAALSEFYSSIEKKIPAIEAGPEAAPQVTEEQIAEAIKRVVAYFKEQREHYVTSAVPLSNHEKALMWPFFCRSARPREDCRTSRSAHSESFFL